MHIFDYTDRDIDDQTWARVLAHPSTQRLVKGNRDMLRRETYALPSTSEYLRIGVPDQIFLREIKGCIAFLNAALDDIHPERKLSFVVAPRAKTVTDD